MDYSLRLEVEYEGLVWCDNEDRLEEAGVVDGSLLYLSSVLS
jgi:hypothetical protein